MLIVVDLSFNNLSTLELGAFSKLNELHTLDLSNNLIETIDKDLFQDNNLLNELHLSHNMIKNIDKDLFKANGNLGTLDLSDNFIETIHEDTFKNNGDLKTLNLKNNPVKNINYNIFGQHIDSVSFYVSWKQMKKLDVSYKTAKVSLNIDDLSKNGKVILGSKYGYYREYYRDVFRHKIKITANIENINYFNISNNGIENIEEAIERVGATVETLDVSNNNFSTGAFTANIFVTHVNLKHLRMSHMHLTEINIDTFSNLVELLILDLSDNLIEFFDENKFVNNNKLKVLNLMNNPTEKLKQIDCGIFTPLMNSILVNFTSDNVKELNTSCLKESLEVDLNSKDDIVLLVKKRNFEFSVPGQNP